MVDTNVLVDALTGREPFARDAQKVLALGYVGEFELWVSAGSIKDLMYVLSDRGKVGKMADALHAEEVLRGFVEVCSLTAQDIDAMIACSWSDPEDYLIELAAEKVKADAIVTGNVKDFDKSRFRVLDCTQLFAYLEKEKRLAFAIVDL